MIQLTKSNYQRGRQCPKLLWISINDKDRVPKPDEATQYRFDIGNDVGDYAKKCFPKGIEVDPAYPPQKNADKTKDLLRLRKPLFEAGFENEGLYARVDVLIPVGTDMWDIIEVKSASKVKNINIHDVAFQKYVCEKAGLKINRCQLMILNTEYVKQGKIDQNLLLKLEDVTELADDYIKEIPELIEKMLQVINLPECPKIKIGHQCQKIEGEQYECPMIEECWSFLPSNSIFDLYYARGRDWELFERNILDLKDIPDDYRLNANQQIQKNCAKTGKIHIDLKGITEFLNSLEYPLYYLDFETIFPGIPLYDGTSPYQQVPFQFSLHIQSEDGSVEHHEFLAEGQKDPRPAFLAKLKSLLGESGTIIAFNQSFEIDKLRQCAKEFPEYQEWFDNILPRFTDLIVPFKSFYWHKADQHGSNSLKKVLPAVTGKGYSGLTISEGQNASIAFISMNFSEMSKEQKIQTRKDLLKYCELDTEGMVWIIEELRGVVGLTRSKGALSDEDYKILAVTGKIKVSKEELNRLIDSDKYLSLADRFAHLSYDEIEKIAKKFGITFKEKIDKIDKFQIYLSIVDSGLFEKLETEVELMT